MVSMADEAEELSGALDRLLTEGRVGTKGRKGDTIRRNRERIVALRAQGWTWDALAKQLASVGFKVSARTLRVETTAAIAEAKKKRPNLKAVAAPKPAAKPPNVAEASATDAKAKPHSTEANFHKIDKEIFGDGN
jgi:hypothetical protein